MALWIAALALWIGSYRMNFDVQIDRTHWNGAGVSQYQIRIGRGAIALSRQTHMARVPSATLRISSWANPIAYDPYGSRQRIAGFGYLHRGWAINAAFPSWSLVILFAIPPNCLDAAPTRSEH